MKYQLSRISHHHGSKPLQTLIKSRTVSAQVALAVIAFMSDFWNAALSATWADITDRKRPFHVQTFRHFARSPSSD